MLSQPQKNEIRQLIERFYQTDFAWVYESIYTWRSKQLRVMIQRSAYRNESFIHGEVLNPVHFNWNLLIDLPVSEKSACYKTVSKRSNESKEPFCKDAETVLEELLKILA